MPSIYSSPEQLQRIQTILTRYIGLPFSTDSIPGAIMEAVLANVRNAEVLKTYDFVDVIKPDTAIGWQVKSTKAGTPVTWKRAKIPRQQELIAASNTSEIGPQALGDAIIDFCNEHALASLRLYKLEQIGYARLILHPDGHVTYFERLLCTKSDPLVFKKQDFTWKWSKAKNTTKKEQLSALHGVNRKSGTKWWAWHGLGENQLHFSGEADWWPALDTDHTVSFAFPSASDRMTLEDFMSMLESFRGAS